MRHREKARLCAEFMVKCLSMGWRKCDLGELEAIWWDGEAWQYTKEYRALEQLRRTEKTKGT